VKPVRHPQRSKLISRLHAILRLDESRQRAELRRHPSAERSAARTVFDGVGRAAQAQIAALLEDSGSNPDRLETVVNRASPLAAITRAVERSDPDLLIVGTRGPGVLRRLFLSSIASSVLREM
jgi:nucleotide-binding universal stress UspA family protein